jgi:glycosyltransferase involved in cell wall biosynthesis
MGDPRIAHAVIDRLGLRDAVVILGPVPDADLPALYTAAELLALPSLHEGFGLPVLEAMACGTPVVAADIPALAETAGGAALLVDPRDASALAAAMRALVLDGALRRRLRAAGLRHAAGFTWDLSAEHTLAVYRSVAPHAGRQN